VTMELNELKAISKPLIDAWNEQDPDKVVACYTEDLVYVDPNTRGAVEGRDAFRRYLTKLFGAWQMHWEVKETFPLKDADGAAGLWRASFRRAGGEAEAQVDGMDLVLIEGELLKRNEVYFDRAALAPLLAEEGALNA
jgi:ketosteroid isomerase-like protein